MTRHEEAPSVRTSSSRTMPIPEPTVGDVLSSNETVWLIRDALMRYQVELLDAGLYNDDYWLCSHCHRAHLSQSLSKIGKRHLKYKVTSQMWKDLKV